MAQHRARGRLGGAKAISRYNLSRPDSKYRKRVRCCGGVNVVKLYEILRKTLVRRG